MIGDVAKQLLATALKPLLEAIGGAADENEVEAGAADWPAVQRILGDLDLLLADDNMAATGFCRDNLQPLRAAFGEMGMGFSTLTIVDRKSVV